MPSLVDGDAGRTRMIPFQFRTFLRVVCAPIPAGERSLRRVVERAIFALTFPLFELWNATLLGFDYVFAPRFRHTPVSAPVFIIGNPRGGTTFLHRLLALDEGRFTTIKAWQLFLPSILAQTCVRLLVRLDRALGAPIGRRVTAAQDRLLQDADAIHHTRLDAPEEDEVLLMHAFASDLVALLFPTRADEKYVPFDDLPEATRTRLMTFYRRCVQRHLFLEGRGRRLLSKNPLFCAKVQSVYATFPEARLIYLVRNPADAIASVLDMVHAIWRVQGVERTAAARLRDDRVIEWAVYCYHHVLAVLDRAPRDRYALVRYEELVQDPAETVEHLYRELGFSMTPAYRTVLLREAARARAYKSRHEYSLEQFGLTHERIEALVPHVYDRFGYPRRAAQHAARWNRVATRA
jgi:omega-hydroxy-beta-dihydromenaquinone-9 sulfotransferase